MENYGVKPGNRVLIRSGNNPALVAAWLAATKAGAVVVNTMPMLRAGELTKIVDKAEIALALTDSRIADELVACAKTSRFLKQVVNFDGTSNHDAELDRVALSKPVRFEAVKTGRDDVALLGFTSGTTGEPKATMHFHRDLLIIADGYAKEVLNVTPDDVFVGSPPLAFTFGLGGLAIFPLRFGATATLLGKRGASRDGQDHRNLQGHDLLHLADRVSGDDGRDGQGRRSVVAAACGLGRRNLAGAGVRELDPQDRQDDSRRHRQHGNAAYLHHQSGRRRRRRNDRAPVSGYEAKIVDDDMNELPAGTVGKLAVRGPTGCRYLADYTAVELCARRLEFDRRYLRPRRERPLLVRGPIRRHDHLVRLQHRRSRDRGGAC